MLSSITFHSGVYATELNAPMKVIPLNKAATNNTANSIVVKMKNSAFSKAYKASDRSVMIYSLSADRGSEARMARSIVTNSLGTLGTVALNTTSKAANGPIQVKKVMSISGVGNVVTLDRALDHNSLNKLINQIKQSNSSVAGAFINYRVNSHLVPNEPYYSDRVYSNYANWARSYAEFSGVDLEQAWGASSDWMMNNPVIVGVLDTEVLQAHPDFGANKFLSGYDFLQLAENEAANTANPTSVSTRDGNGYDNNASDPGDWNTNDICSTGADASDSSWHGTATSGLIGALGNNGIGFVGVNWGAKILPGRVLGSCGGTLVGIIEGMQWAAGFDVTGVDEQGNNVNIPAPTRPARVVNMSLGVDGAPCYDIVQEYVDEILKSGTIFVASTGNSASAVALPANCKGIISVAATNRWGARTYYSNYGDNVSIAAPGGDSSSGTNIARDYIAINSNSGKTVPDQFSIALGQGTSFSAPIVSGVLSLMMAKRLSIVDKFPEPSSNVYKQKLLASASSFKVNPFSSSPDCTTSTCGAGVVNAKNAIDAISTPPTVELISGIRPNSTFYLGINDKIRVEGYSSDDRYSDFNTRKANLEVDVNGVVQKISYDIGLNRPVNGKKHHAIDFSTGKADSYKLKLQVTDDTGLTGESDKFMVRSTFKSSTNFIYPPITLQGKPQERGGVDSQGNIKIGNPTRPGMPPQEYQFVLEIDKRVYPTLDGLQIEIRPLSGPQALRVNRINRDMFSFTTDTRTRSGMYRFMLIVRNLQTGVFTEKQFNVLVANQV